MSTVKTKEIGLLIQECTQQLRDLRYSDCCVAMHQKMWEENLLPYLSQRGAMYYSSFIGQEYLDSVCPTLTLYPKRVLTRSVHILSVYLETGSIPKRIVPLVKHSLPGEVGNAAVAFLEMLRRMRRKEITIIKHHRNLSYFIAFLNLKNKTTIAEIDHTDILTFFSTEENIKDRYSTMRLFCCFLYEQKYTQTNLTYLIGHHNFPVREKLPSFYCAEEVRQIEASAEQSSPTGKRDYAILLLATRLGFRASDICKLRFSHIDWECNRIQFTQYKTGRPVELPLLTEVGEAIVNYLRYVRPISDFQEIFLFARSPHAPMTGSAINSAVSQIIRKSGVDTSQRKLGPHSMRHSLASRLLYNGVSLPVISEALGHKNTQTTMEYLRIDVTSLRKCALEVPPVATGFYEQKGGVFYG